MAILEPAIKIRKQLPGVGTGKLHHLLTDFFTEHNLKLGRDKHNKLLQEHHLLRTKKRKGARTTNSQHPFYNYANLVKEFTATRSNQLWVSDITYIRTGNDFRYLSLITNAYSHKIVGYRGSGNITYRRTIDSIANGSYNLTKGKEKLIHHSDRGLQYCCKEYIQPLCSNNIQISMTTQGNPGENAIAEPIT